MIGSHLDTQPTGGKFDGVLGVMAGLEILRRLEEAGIARAPPDRGRKLDQREGCRFAPAMLASAAYAGVLPAEKAMDTRDIAGVRFGDALENLGIVPDRPLEARKSRPISNSIEQGPILEAEGKESACHRWAGLFWYDAVITGFESHSGSTPMHMRDDALVAAAQLSEALRKIGTEAKSARRGDRWASSRSFPNSRNVIPGEVRMTIDMRHPDPAVLRAMDARFHETVRFPPKGRIRIDLKQVAATQAALLRSGHAGHAARGGRCHGHFAPNIISGAARCLPHGEDRAGGADLHALRGRCEPQRGREHRAASARKPARTC